MSSPECVHCLIGLSACRAQSAAKEGCVQVAFACSSLSTDLGVSFQDSQRSVLMHSDDSQLSKLVRNVFRTALL